MTFFWNIKLNTLISNLVENAVKYSGDTVRIIIGCKTFEDDISIIVKDNGNGISDGDLNKIFTKFYRSSDAMQSGMPGVGLGLAYVKLLTEAHSGQVSVISHQGKGSTFIIKLPQK
mgnify:CR=1 FL=1